jgi:hypothetical protein
MNSNPVSSEYVYLYDFSQKITLATIPNYTSHLKNPDVLMVTTSKIYILLL